MNVSKRTDRWKKPKKLIEDKTDNCIYKKINNDLMESIPADIIYMAVISLKTS